MDGPQHTDDLVDPAAALAQPRLDISVVAVQDEPDGRFAGWQGHPEVALAGQLGFLNGAVGEDTAGVLSPQTIGKGVAGAECRDFVIDPVKASIPIVTYLECASTGTAIQSAGRHAHRKPAGGLPR
jgi:hypothetical protein